MMIHHTCPVVTLYSINNVLHIPLPVFKGLQFLHGHVAPCIFKFSYQTTSHLHSIQVKLGLTATNLEEKFGLEKKYPLTTQRYLLLAENSI